MRSKIDFLTFSFFGREGWKGETKVCGASWEVACARYSEWSEVWRSESGKKSLTTQSKHRSTRTNSLVEPIPYACALPYHPGSGSHRQLFRPWWGSSAWYSQHGLTCWSQILLFTAEADAKAPLKRRLHTTHGGPAPPPHSVFLLTSYSAVHII